MSITLLILLLSQALGWAGMITLGWEESDDPTVTGYRLYYAATNGSVTNSVDVGKVSVYTFTNLASTPTWFFFTAYNREQMQSKTSRVICDTPLPADRPPAPLRLRRVPGTGPT